MKVKMRSISANEFRILDAGKVYNLPTKEAESFVDAGYAELVDDSDKALRVTKPDPEENTGASQPKYE